jgi:acetylornithine/N-succinyldiaminopimelate aminotransferase
VPRRATETGERLTKALQSVPGVAAVRGTGLLIAIELEPGTDAAVAARSCLDHGLVVNAVTPTALRIAPSLLVTEAECDEAVRIIEEVLA